jgi:hypothetical protein
MVIHYSSIYELEIEYYIGCFQMVVEDVGELGPIIEDALKIHVWRNCPKYRNA